MLCEPHFFWIEGKFCVATLEVDHREFLEVIVLSNEENNFYITRFFFSCSVRLFHGLLSKSALDMRTIMDLQRM